METTAVRNVDFLMAFALVVFPLLRAFQPDMIFVSAGMDCLRGDPIGQMRFITPEVIHHIVFALCQFQTHPDVLGSPTAHQPQPNRLLVALEGGYNDIVVANGVCTIVQALLEATRVSSLLRDNHPSSADSASQLWTHLPHLFDPTEDSENSRSCLDDDPFDANSDGPELKQFYATLGATIHHLSQYWPCLLTEDGNPIFFSSFARLIELLDSTSASALMKDYLRSEQLKQFWSQSLDHYCYPSPR